MSLDVKVLFGNLSLVSAPAFSYRTRVLRMAGYSPDYPVNTSENGDFNLGSVFSPGFFEGVVGGGVLGREGGRNVRDY